MGENTAGSSGRGNSTKKMGMARPYATKPILYHWPSSPELEPPRPEEEKETAEHLAAGA